MQRNHKKKRRPTNFHPLNSRQYRPIYKNDTKPWLLLWGSVLLNSLRISFFSLCGFNQHLSSIFEYSPWNNLITLQHHPQSRSFHIQTHTVPNPGCGISPRDHHLSTRWNLQTHIMSQNYDSRRQYTVRCLCRKENEIKCNTSMSS